MDHRREQSKLDQVDESSATKDQNPTSYYYDDATNYETYRDDEEEDDDESLPQKNNVQD